MGDTLRKWGLSKDLKKVSHETTQKKKTPRGGDSKSEGSDVGVCLVLAECVKG